MPDLFRYPLIHKLYTVAYPGRWTPEPVRGDDCGEESYLASMADPRETELTLDPKYDAAGLVTAVVTARGGAPLMVAHMNADALRLTIGTGEAHFWSRSRGRLWKKGETSGNVLHVVELRVDCDQDAIWVIADPAGPACHTGAVSCFYRRVDGDRLVPIA